TVADIHLAHLEGYQSIEHLKRYTTTGMATDQGKTSNLNALSILAELKNLPVSQIGTTTFRPPYTPVDFGAVVGQKTNELFMPKRTTPMHPSHLAEQCIFEDVGDWKRPFCFTQKHETIEQAVRRECMQARQDAGLLDASTLGKIDIQGKDAGQFLDLIYTNLFSKLAIGSCRYGLMLNEHGMVFDDGVTTRLAENHYHMTTTTGGAANVLNWLEMWLQTEWPDLKVYCASVTEQWAVATLSGPKARDILTPLCEFDISHDAFKHMTSRTGKIAGVEGRIFRISFTGDTAFEINVPARFGHYLWQTIRQAGKAYDLCLYGTQAMHVLRAEKGYIIVGQDSDGTMTADDLGLNWIISKKKEDFLGKRSLIRSDIVRKDRKQLVGILVENQNVVLPEGAHLVETLKHAPPMHMLGHITSSYYSPTLKRSFALAVVQRGRERIGEHLYVPLMNGHHQKVKLVNPVFFDPENKRLN
ncbi:MAG: glycine cleavage T C-terminal barrel domain-containing protein, partial [Pseudomonadota bacterium]